MSDHMGLSSTVRCGVLCVALLTGAPALQAESWRPLGPGGGTVQALLLDPWAPRVLYAAVNGGVYRSDDGGVSWVWRGQGLGNEMWDQSIQQFAADPSHPGTIYAMSFSTLYRSTNDGASWSPLYQLAYSSDGKALAIIPGARPTILLGDGDDVLRSADGGVTWSTIYSGDGLVERVVADPVHPGEVFVGALDGVWKVDGAGAVTLLLADGGSDLVMAPSDPLTLYALAGYGWRTRDGGQTWTEFTGPKESPIDGSCLVVSPVAPATVYMCEYFFGVLVSYDAGDTWRQLSKGFPTYMLDGEASPQPASAVVIDPRATGSVWAAVSAYGVLSSADGGRSWSLPEQTGLTASPVDFLTFDTNRPETLYARFEPQLDIEVSVDGGRNWSVMAGAPPESTVVLNPAEAGTLYAVNGTGLSRNAGDGEWSLLLGGVIYGAAFPSPGVIVAGDCWLSRSVDGGQTWTKTIACHRFLPNQALLALHFISDPTDSQTLYAQITRGQPRCFFCDLETWRSDDAGATWQLILTNSPAPALDPTHHGWLWVAIFNSVARTIDGGRHWTVMGEIPGVDSINTLISSPTEPGVLYAGAGLFAGAGDAQGVFRSYDQGRSWSPLNEGLNGHLTINWLGVNPSDPHRIYAIPSEGGLFRFLERNQG